MVRVRWGFGCGVLVGAGGKLIRICSYMCGILEKGGDQCASEWLELVSWYCHGVLGLVGCVCDMRISCSGLFGFLGGLNKFEE